MHLHTFYLHCIHMDTYASFCFSIYLTSPTGALDPWKTCRNSSSWWSRTKRFSGWWMSWICLQTALTCLSAAAVGWPAGRMVISLLRPGLWVTVLDLRMLRFQGSLEMLFINSLCIEIYKFGSFWFMTVLSGKILREFRWGTWGPLTGLSCILYREMPWVPRLVHQD